jgi:hypothetical protein
METPNFSSRMCCCFPSMISFLDHIRSVLHFCFQSREHVSFFFCFLFLRPGVLQPVSASILFRPCLGFSSISVWVRSPFCSCAEAAAAAGSGEFAPPIVRSLLTFSVRFLYREFVRSLLLHFVDPQRAP